MSNLPKNAQRARELRLAATSGPWTVYHRNTALGDNPSLEKLIENKEDPNFTFLGSHLKGPTVVDRGDFTAIDAEFIASCPETQERFEKALEIALYYLSKINKYCDHIGPEGDDCFCSSAMTNLAGQAVAQIEAIWKDTEGRGIVDAIRNI